MKRSLAWSLLALVGLSLCHSVVHAEPPAGSKLTPLDNYVAKPDSAYAWNVAETIQSWGLTTHVIRLTSQRWRTEQEVTTSQCSQRGRSTSC
ncbi:MAG: PhoPQ-activated protein PqaA family protein, partial [Pirellula sp.]